MFLYIFILFGAWEGLAEPIFTCDDNPFRLCAQPVEGKDRKFPSTEEEIFKLCPYFMAYQRCLREFAEKCGEDSVNIAFFSFEKQRKIVEVAEEICDADSTLHSNVVGHIGCLSNVTEYGDCSEYARKKLQTVIDILQKAEEDDTESSTDNHRVWQSVGCVFDVQQTACFIAKTQEMCGQGAKDLIIRLMERTDYLGNSCQGTKPDEIEEIVEIMELNEEEQSALKEFINLK